MLELHVNLLLGRNKTHKNRNNTFVCHVCYYIIIHRQMIRSGLKKHCLHNSTALPYIQFTLEKLKYTQTSFTINCLLLIFHIVNI